MQQLLINKFFNKEVFFLLSRDDFLVSHLLFDVPKFDVSVGVEVLFTDLCDLEETLKGVLGYHRFEFCFFNFSFVLLCLLVKNRRSVTHVNNFLFLKFISQGFS